MGVLRHKNSEDNASGMVATIAAAAIVLAALLVFILQNGERVTVQFFTVQGTLPLALAMLFAAVAAALVVALVGSARVLRRTRRK